MEMQDLNTNLVRHVTEWLYTINLTVNLQGTEGTILKHFETILMHAERLGYEIQDILYGNALFELKWSEVVENHSLFCIKLNVYNHAFTTSVIYIKSPNKYYALQCS